MEIYNQIQQTKKNISIDHSSLEILDNHWISGYWYYDTQATNYSNIDHCVIMIVRPTTPTVHT